MTAPLTAGSVEAVHERLIWVAETAVAVTPVGTEGAVMSGVGATTLVTVTMIPADVV